MASKIGVYFDVQNIGGGLDVEALAEQVRSKWSDLTPVVKVLPMLSVAENEVRADIEANGLDGVLFCGASPRDEATPWQLPVQVEHVNLREQCVLAYKNPDGSAVSGAAPALLTQMATDYVNMGVVKLQKSNMPESAAIEGIKRILVIGGGWTGLTAAQEAAKTGYEVILVEKADKLGGAVNNMPMGSPLQAPWEDRQPTNLADKIAAVTGNSSITVLLNAHMAKLEGQPGEFKATVATANGEQTFDIGSVVLATGWVPLAEKYLESMGLGVNPKVVHAAQFAKMLGEGKVDARRIAFVLDTTIAEEALQKAADEAAAAEAEAHALLQRKALGALHQHRTQHAAVDRRQRQDAEQLAAVALAPCGPEHDKFKQAHHRHAGQIDQRTELGGVGLGGDEAARIERQRSHQHLRDTEQQGEPPATGALVAHQLDEAGHAEAPGEHRVLCKDGQHGVAKKYADGLHHIIHPQAPPLSGGRPP